MDNRHMRYVLRMAGLSAEDLGRLCGVSRVAAYAWLNGGEIHPLRASRVIAIMQSIEAAANARDLPVDRKRGDWRNKDTLDRIKSIVIKHLQRLPKKD